MKLWLAAAVTIFASPCFAQPIAPTRTFGGSVTMNPIQPQRPPGTNTTAMQGMQPPPKQQFGYHEMTLTPILPPPPMRSQKAVNANTTDADPLTLSEPGHGALTNFYDPSPNAPPQSLPGQKREIMRDR